MTVASMPMWSAVARSIPADSPVAPRQMLPPPTTTAICTPRSRWHSAISVAMRATVAPSMVSSTSDEAKASPDILRTTRPQRGFDWADSSLASSLGGSLMGTGSAADDDLGEPGHGRASEELLDGLLVVLGVGLFEQ